MDSLYHYRSETERADTPMPFGSSCAYAPISDLVEVYKFNSSQVVVIKACKQTAIYLRLVNNRELITWVSGASDKQVVPLMLTKARTY